jgi:hypothetical protein
MMGGFGTLFGVLYGLLALLSIAAMACGIWFFVKGAQYFQSKLEERPVRSEFQAELLAKMDQMVDVLKVK